MTNYADSSEVKSIVSRALKEDIGDGDITTRHTIGKKLFCKAAVVAGEKGILCGLNVAQAVFQTVDPAVKFQGRVPDGSRVRKGTVVAYIQGRARNILSAERVGLNFLSLLSGIATRTRMFVEAVRPYPVQIFDTRKTLPGLRFLEKYAVRTGGGHNHRMSLDTMVLIKENHLDTIESADLAGVVSTIRRTAAGSCLIEIEARTLEEFIHALSAKPDIMLLDNMSARDVRTAVAIRTKVCRRHKRVLLEVSGNIRQSTIKRYAATGVERISLGTLTKDICSLDFSLDICEREER